VKLAAHDRVVVVGITGSGKSYWTKREIVDKAPHVVVWDPHGEYAEDAEDGDGCAGVRGVPLDTLDAELEDDNARVAVVPEYRTLDELSKQFVVFCDVAKECRDVLLVVDEIGLLYGAPKHVEYLATQSRHWGCPLVLIAQRAVQIPSTARDQASRIVSFRQIRPDDIEALADRIGERAERIGKLPRRERVEWHEDEAFKTD
jgi:hypothetical protein